MATHNMATHIKDAKLVELVGADHTPYVGDSDALLDEIEEFLTGIRHGAEPDRTLATILFTDIIVDSTKQAAEMGGRKWGELLQQHHVLVRRELARFRGREVNTAGGGFLIAFDGPGRGHPLWEEHFAAGALVVYPHRVETPFPPF